MKDNTINVLVAVAAYPDNSRGLLMNYVHTRNIYYKARGVQVTVLNFSADEDYTIDNISVITLKRYQEYPEQYGVLICHAPNIRNHYFFIKKYSNRFQNIVFFFHGHEVLRINEAYSKPYPYMKKKGLIVFLQNRYDDLKLFTWKKYIRTNKEKLTLIFVSNWMLNQFEKWTEINYEEISSISYITYNCIGALFEHATFDMNKDKKYDFITIRNNLDGSKYCIDIVNSIARKNPECKFLIIGKGEFFLHYSKAHNIEWVNKTMNHQEIIKALQNARCALMPTRTDAQGLMMCEMASTGIPLITSDIDVCHEVFEGFDNVSYISNDEIPDNIGAILTCMEQGNPYRKNNKYFNSNTSQKEIDIIHQLYISE